MYKCSAVFVLLLLVAVIVSCENKAERERRTKETAREVAKLQMERAIKELAVRHNALTDWEINYHTTQGQGEILYTIQLQDLLAGSERPVLFSGYIRDIFKRDGECYIRFIKSYSWILQELAKGRYPTSAINLQKIHFILKYSCDRVPGIIATVKNQTEADPSASILRLLGRPPTAYYVVVARIREVSRPDLRITGYSGSSEEVDLQYKSPRIFIATGECIDLTYIGETGKALEE